MLSTSLKKYTKKVLIVVCSTYDLLCDYYVNKLLQYFLYVINKYLTVTSKKGPEHLYLNLIRIQSPHGIRIYKKKHQ